MGLITIELDLKAVKREPKKQATAPLLRSPSLHQSNHVALASTNRLKYCSHNELRKISCKVERGVLIIYGQVSSFYWKQLAQEIIRPISQSLLIENQLEVRSETLNET